MAELKWDRAFALEQASDDEELLDELLQLFHEASASDLEKIKVSAENNDPVAMGDASHSIKGAAASLGIEGIRDVAASLEKAGRGGNLEEALSFLPELEDLLKQFEMSA